METKYFLPANFYEHKIRVVVDGVSGVLYAFDEGTFTVEYDFQHLVEYDRSKYSMVEALGVPGQLDLVEKLSK